jgi:hypothetical protein
MSTAYGPLRSTGPQNGDVLRGKADADQHMCRCGRCRFPEMSRWKPEQKRGFDDDAEENDQRGAGRPAFEADIGIDL